MARRGVVTGAGLLTPRGSATLPGEPLALERAPLGLLAARAQTAGTLELRWSPRGRGFRWLSLAALLALAVLRVRQRA